MDEGSPEALETFEVDVVDSEARRHGPDMTELDTGELTAPAQGEWDCTDEGENLVAAVLTAVKAFVRVYPHTVGTVTSFGLGDHILKHRLQVYGV